MVGFASLFAGAGGGGGSPLGGGGGPSVSTGPAISGADGQQDVVFSSAFNVGGAANPIGNSLSQLVPVVIGGLAIWAVVKIAGK